MYVLKVLLARSANWKTLFDPETAHFRTKVMMLVLAERLTLSAHAVDPLSNLCCVDP